MNKANGLLTDKTISRRSVLKGGAAIAGVTAITGFPTVWAQNIKDVTLTHTGMSYSTIADIARQASQDLGFKVEMSVVDHPGLTNRMVNDPKSIDIADMEIWQSKIVIPQGVTQAVEIAKIKNWGDLTPLYTEGKFAGKEVSRQGDSPFEFMYRDAKDATAFAGGPTGWASFCPGFYNADTLGIRPDLVGREITSWADLISPDFKGKAAIQNIPTIGIMDAIMAFEAAGQIKYGDKGNPTKDELEQTISKLIELKKAGHFRALWNTFDESVNLMAAGEVVIQSMWSPAVTAVQGQGRQMHLPAAQGRLSRLGQRAWHNGPCRRREARRGLRVSQLVQCRLDRWLHRQAGLLQRQSEVRDGGTFGERPRLLLRGQGRDCRYHQPDRREDQSGRRPARRRLLRGALLQGGGVEQPHGRGRVPVRQVERIQRRLRRFHDETAAAANSPPLRLIALFRHGETVLTG